MVLGLWVFLGLVVVGCWLFVVVVVVAGGVVVVAVSYTHLRAHAR